MLEEFKSFIARGNVMDMAVGIIIGAAFTAIVSSLVSDLLNPIIALFTGGIDFSGWFYALDGGSYASLAAAQEAGAAVFAIGNFVMAVINFVIVAFAVFLLVKAVNRAKDGLSQSEEAPADHVEDAAPPQPTEVELLQEIRDALKAR